MRGRRKAGEIVNATTKKARARVLERNLGEHEGRDQERGSTGGGIRREGSREEFGRSRGEGSGAREHGRRDKERGFRWDQEHGRRDQERGFRRGIWESTRGGIRSEGAREHGRRDKERGFRWDQESVRNKRSPHYSR